MPLTLKNSRAQAPTDFRLLGYFAIVAVLAGLLAYFVRHNLVEPATMASYCSTMSDTWRCALRSLSIQLFENQKLGWIALLSSILAYAAILFHSPLTANILLLTIAMFSSVAGLVLYNSVICAPALLLGLLAIQDLWKQARQRQTTP